MASIENIFNLISYSKKCFTALSPVWSDCNTKIKTEREKISIVQPPPLA